MCKKTIAKKTIEAKKNYLKNKSGTIARTKARWCREREHRAIVIERRGATSNAMECMCQSQSLLDSRPINPLVYDPIWIFYWHLFELNVDISRRSSSPMTINAVFLWYEAFFYYYYYYYYHSENDIHLNIVRAWAKITNEIYVTFVIDGILLCFYIFTASKKMI